MNLRAEEKSNITITTKELREVLINLSKHCDDNNSDCEECIYSYDTDECLFQGMEETPSDWSLKYILLFIEGLERHLEEHKK